MCQRSASHYFDTRYYVKDCSSQGVGPPHPFVELMWGLASSFQNMAPFVTERFALVAGMPQIANTYFARIVRAVQLSVQGYLQQVSTNLGDGVVGIPLPSFASLLQDLKRGTFHMSSNWVAIPEEYLSTLPITTVGVNSAATRTNVSLGGGTATSGFLAHGQRQLPRAGRQRREPSPGHGVYVRFHATRGYAERDARTPPATE